MKALPQFFYDFWQQFALEPTKYGNLQQTKIQSNSSDLITFSFKMSYINKIILIFITTNGSFKINSYRYFDMFFEFDLDHFSQEVKRALRISNNLSFNVILGN